MWSSTGRAIARNTACVPADTTVWTGASRDLQAWNIRWIEYFLLEADWLGMLGIRSTLHEYLGVDR